MATSCLSAGHRPSHLRHFESAWSPWVYQSHPVKGGGSVQQNRFRLPLMASKSQGCQTSQRMAQHQMCYKFSPTLHLAHAIAYNGFMLGNAAAQPLRFASTAQQRGQELCVLSCHHSASRVPMICVRIWHRDCSPFGCRLSSTWQSPLGGPRDTCCHASTEVQCPSTRTWILLRRIS